MLLPLSRIMPPSLPPLLVALLLLCLLLLPTPTLCATYSPLAYDIPAGTEECLYERIGSPNEDLTASVFVLSGDELRCAIVLEGPVAPVDIDPDDSEQIKKGSKHQSVGKELKNYLTRYDKEGMKTFVNKKYSASMTDVKPVRIAEMVDFEEEEEDYFDDYAMTDRDRGRFYRQHDIEHQHPPVHERRNILPEKGDEDKDSNRDSALLDSTAGRRRRQIEKEHEIEDDYIRMREERRRKAIVRETMVDDDFVKLQMDHQKRDEGRGPQKHRIEDVKDVKREDNRKERRAKKEEQKEQQSPEVQQRRRRLREEEIKLLAGEPYQRTIQVKTPGWYRLCVKSHASLEVEMELRKSSLYGAVDPRTGHVPSLEYVETKSAIHHLYEKEDDAQILAEEGAIQDSDLNASKEQLRILERVYADIINKQLEERRTWNWRTIKNQHLHSHLVLGNLVETIVYMGITGWQVYTIRKWFSGGPALGR